MNKEIKQLTDVMREYLVLSLQVERMEELCTPEVVIQNYRDKASIVADKIIKALTSRKEGVR